MAGLKELRQKMATEKQIAEKTVELPSNRKRASIRPMKVKEQRAVLKAIEKRDEYNINNAFDAILDKCVVSIEDEPYENDDIVIQDRTFLLIKIQELSTGSKTKISHINPETEEVVNDIEVDISKFPVNYFEGELEKEVQLSEHIYAKLGPVTRGDEKDIDRWIRKNKSEESLIDRRYCAYASVIKSIFSKDIDEETEEQSITEYDVSFDDKVKFIDENCSSEELKVIDNFIKTLNFGIELKFHFEDNGYVNEEEEANILSFFIN